MTEFLLLQLGVRMFEFLLTHFMLPKDHSESNPSSYVVLPFLTLNFYEDEVVLKNFTSHGMCS